MEQELLVQRALLCSALRGSFSQSEAPCGSGQAVPPGAAAAPLFAEKGTLTNTPPFVRASKHAFFTSLQDKHFVILKKNIHFIYSLTFFAFFSFFLTTHPLT